MALIDILVVGLVLAFVVSRFIRHQLPKDSRKRSERKGEWQRFTSQFVREEEPKSVAQKPQRPVRKLVEVEGLSGMSQLRAVDESFDEQDFKNGVEKAYRYFHECWNNMDSEGLDKLCGPDLMDKLEATLEDYRTRKVRPHVTVGEVGEVEILDVHLKGRTAVIETRISAMQNEVEVKIGKQAAVGKLHPVSVVWVLARAVMSDDPNWELASIRHEGAAA